jgi:hypothetical protein
VSQFERPNIAKMQGYTSGEQPQDGRSIKLNTNEIRIRQVRMWQQR